MALAGLPAIVIALVGSNPFPQGAVARALFGWTLLAILFEILRRDRGFPVSVLTTPPVILTLALALLMLALLGGSPSGEYGSLKLQLFVVANVTLLFAGVLIGRRRDDFDLYVALVFLLAVGSALVLVTKLGETSIETGIAGRFALFPEENPIQFGRASAVGLIVTVYVVLAARAPWQRLVAVAAMPLMVVALISAGSRGPLLGSFVGLLILLVLVLRAQAGWIRPALVAIGGAAAVLLTIRLVPSESSERALSLFGNDVGGLSAEERVGVWSQALDAFRENVLFGLGTGGFERIAPTDIYPHNILLEAAAELGILGLLLVLALLIVGAARLVRVWASASGGDQLQAALVVALFGSAIVNAFVSGDIQSNWAIWLSLGIGLGLGVRGEAAAILARGTEQLPPQRLRAPLPVQARTPWHLAATLAEPAEPVPPPAVAVPPPAVAQTKEDRVVQTLVEFGRPVREELVRAALGVSRTTLTRYLRRLEVEGRVVRTGQGRRGDPYVYEAVSEQAPAPVVGDGRPPA